MELKCDLRGHSKVIFTLRWTLTGPDSSNPHLPLRLCTASFDGTVKIWSDSGDLLLDLCQQVQPVYSLSPSPDGLYIATGSLGGNVSLWAASSGEIKREIQGSGDTFDISWSKDGKQFSSCFSSGQVYVIQVPSESDPDGGSEQETGAMAVESL
jgi:transducin (beta)-like 1